MGYDKLVERIGQDLKLKYGIKPEKKIALIHCFNPSHEIALAANKNNFMPKGNVQDMERQLWYAPYLYMNDDDIVFNHHENKFYDANHSIVDIRNINDTVLLPCPWGWNLNVRKWFEKAGVSQSLMPSKLEIAKIRELASRKFAAGYINLIFKNKYWKGIKQRLVGHNMTFVENIKQVEWKADNMIFKLPWSSSGRGIYIARKDDERAEEKIQRMISSQGGVLADIFYDKLIDFAMEFYLGYDGDVDFLGFSIFNAMQQGKYAGNMVDSQKVIKLAIANTLGDESLIDHVLRAHLFTIKNTLAGAYNGVVGIDMMVVNTEDGVKIHPCVEINLRLNMGIMAMEAYRRFFFFDLVEVGSEEGAVRRSSIFDPSDDSRERGFHIGLRSRNISIWYS